MPRKTRFYMICLRDSVGSNAAFHCHNGGGYSTSIDRAQVFTLKEAQAYWNTLRPIDLPVCADSVDKQAVIHVDHQHVPGSTVIEEGCTQYVAFVKGQWDGNDLYWLRDGGLPTTDFTKASIYANANTESDGLVWLPFHIADGVKRRTFPLHLLNRRRMVQGAGLRIPDHIRKANRKQRNSGKTRWNCPVCGRFSYQDHPYEFEGCKNSACGDSK